MKHFFTISGELNDDTLRVFQEDWRIVEEGDNLIVFINSPGGSIYICDIILQMIRNADFEITLMAVGEIFSAAFELFYRADCDKLVHPNTIGMYHYGFSGVEVDEKGRPKGEQDAARMQYLRGMQPNTLRLCELLGMTRTEIRKIKAGKEVYFQPARLLEFLKAFEDNREKIIA